MSFHREYLVRLPLPLAQLYSRAHNAKDARGRHDNTFYLFEALVKLTVAPLAAAYLAEIARGGKRSAQLDRLLAQLSLPSLGQWTAMLRELSRHFGDPAYAATHPLGHLWQQLCAPRKDLPGALALYRRIKNGPDGQPAGDQSVSLLALLDSLVQYRNAVFGHGGPRFASFYEQEMGPLLFPAADELLAEETCQWWGPRGTRLVYLTELRGLDERRFELGLKELIGLQAERSAPVEVPAAQATDMAPNRMGILWPGHSLPLPLDPMLVYRETELSEEVLFLNRELQGRQVQYLSYTTGRTERDKTMGDAMARLLSQITGREVSPAELERLQEQSVAETPSVEALFDEKAPSGRIVGDYEILTQIGRGGMGVVYLARQLSLGRIVALKMLPADLAGDDVALARFRREMRALARCDHPHIVKVLASGTLPDGQLYYAMEYVPGADLEHVWRELAKSNGQGNVSTLGGTTWANAVLSASRKQREQTTRAASGDSTDSGAGDVSTPLSPPGRGQGEGSNRAQGGSESSLSPLGRGQTEGALAAAFLPPLPELPDAADDPGGYSKRVAVLIRDAALSLQAVHEQQIVHRDVKPANLMLTPDGQRVVLMDFGLAKGDSMSLTASRAGGFLGTLRYAAPEQLASASMNIGPAADIRGLGVVLWELLTRKRLFAEAQDERQLAQWIFDRDVPSLRSIDATFDRDLEAIVSRATERSTSDRIASANDLANYLQLYVDDQPLPIRPPGLGELTMRWVRQHAGLVASGALAAAAIVITTVVAFAMINAAKNEAIVARDKAQRSEADAVAARDEAQKSEAAALDARQKAEVSEQNALYNAETADEQRNLALDTISTLVLDVQKRLAETPVQRQLKETILDTAKLGLQRISQSFTIARSMDARAKRKIAVAQLKTADILLALGMWTEAGTFCQGARDTFKNLAAAEPANVDAQRDLSLSYNKLGDVNIVRGDLNQTKENYLQGLEITKRLSETDPNNLSIQQDLSRSYNNLGRLSMTSGNFEGALKFYELGIGILRRVADVDRANAVIQRDLSNSYERLGDVYVGRGDWRGAREIYQKKLEIAQRLMLIDPKNTRDLRDVSTSYESVGTAHMLLGQIAEAREAYQKSLTIRQQLAEGDPSNAQAQYDLFCAHRNSAEAYIRHGSLEDAKTHCLAMLDVAGRLAKADPDNARTEGDLWRSHKTLGDVVLRLGQISAAEVAYRQAREIAERLGTFDFRNVREQFDLSISYQGLGDVELQLSNVTAARAAYQHALEISQRVAPEFNRVFGKEDPSSTSVSLEIGRARYGIGMCQQKEQKWADAIEEYVAARETINAVMDKLKSQNRLPKSDERLLTTIERLLTTIEVALNECRAALKDQSAGEKPAAELVEPAKQ